MSEEPKFADHLAILDRYQSFSAEILRLALLAIGVVGFLVTNASKTDGLIQLTSSGVRAAMSVSLATLALASTLALSHRYWSTESMAAHLRLLHLRSQKPENETAMRAERSARQQAFAISAFSIGGASALLALGALALAVTFGLALQTGTKPSSGSEPTKKPPAHAVNP
jgi:hypothetical protein